MTDDEAPLPGWMAVDVGPIGPNFVWVVRVRSSRPADAEHPWQVVKHGLCQREMQGQLRGGEVARSITYRVERVLEELCCTGSDREFPRARDLEDGPVRVGWWRSTPAMAGGWPTERSNASSSRAKRRASRRSSCSCRRS